MATDSSHPPQTTKALAAMERERKEEKENKKTVWGFVWTLFGFKIVTIGVIWYAAAGSRESSDMIMATTWFWLLIPAVAIAGPLLYRYRLIRQRRRRETLRNAEWSTTGGAPAAPTDSADVQIIFHLPDPDRPLI